MSIKDLHQRSNSGRLPFTSNRKPPKYTKNIPTKDEKHIHWKDPPVDEIHHYTPLPPVPRVHWRDPIVEGTYRYPSTRSKTPKLPPTPKDPAKGILKEDRVAEPTIPGSSVGIVDGGVSGLDERKYPPLIPLPKEHPKKGILKNGKRDVYERDYAENIIDEPEFELPTDDQLNGLTIDCNLAEISGDGNKFDLSLDIGRNVHLQPHVNTVAGTKYIQTLSTAGSGEQVPQSGFGMEFMIIPITLILFGKSLMQAFENRGKNGARLHARQWRDVTA